MPSFDAVAGLDGGSAVHSSISDSHTLGSGSDRVVLALVHAEDVSSPNQQSASAVTYDGVAMTKLGERAHSGGFNTWEAWYILEADLPAAGSYTCAVTFEGNVTNSQLHVISLADGAQEAPVFASSEASSTATISTNITTTAADAMLVELVGNGHNTPPTVTHSPQSGQTERSDVTGDSSSSATSTEAVTTAQQYTQTWNLSTSTGRVGHVVTAVNPAGVGGVIVQASPATLMVAAQTTSPTLTALAVQASPSDLDFVAQAVSPTPSALAVSAAPAGLSVEAQTVNPVVAGTPVTITAAPATLNVAAQSVTPTLAPAVIALTPAGLTVAAQSVSSVFGALAISASPAELTLAAQAVNSRVTPLGRFAEGYGASSPGKEVSSGVGGFREGRSV